MRHLKKETEQLFPRCREGQAAPLVSVTWVGTPPSLQPGPDSAVAAHEPVASRHRMPPGERLARAKPLSSYLSPPPASIHTGKSPRSPRSPRDLPGPTSASSTLSTMNVQYKSGLSDRSFKTTFDE